MNARFLYTSDTARESIEELSLVTLTRAVAVPGKHRMLPIGAAGTVVGVLEGGTSYVVEFVEPFPALVDLVANEIAAVPGESRADLAARGMARRAS